MNKTKPYDIPKQQVWEAYKRVKAARGSAGIDEQSMTDFEKDLKGNLYKIWNRMSSGSYVPPPVKRVSIEKKDGGQRHLGVPTISDRIAQMVVKISLEPVLEPKFHEDSYGYRPKKSAHQAVEKCQWRCWWKDWVIDIDIKGFFDNIDHRFMMQMVKEHTSCPWIILYIERWLKAPVQLDDGAQEARSKGTPQGGVISPLLANLFLHQVFDEWMKMKFGNIRFERYADDIIVHANSEEIANYFKRRISERFKQFKLELHPEKTKVVYCRDSVRKETTWLCDEFDFLGFTFKRRTARNKDGELFDGFLPAISKSAKKKIHKQIHDWRMHRQYNTHSLEEVAKAINPVVRGWFLYYGKFYKTEMGSIYWQLQKYLTRWATKKHKRFKRRPAQAYKWILEHAYDRPELFAHWAFRRKKMVEARRAV